MHPGILRGGLIPSILFVAACGASKPSAPIVELRASGDTVGTSYGDVTEAVWLGAKRWAILAPAEETVALVDLDRRITTALGRGSSAELRNPAHLFGAEDTLYVGDWGLRRLTLWAPPNRLARSVPAPAVTRGTLPQARDAAGRYYLDLFPAPGPDGSGNRDSAAVVRTDPGLTRIDTVARLAPLDIAEVMGDAGRRFERRVFSGADHWGVLPDGSLWVARVYDNRVDWRSPGGKWTKGKALPDRVLEVTRYDRELFLRKFPPELRRTAQELPFAALKPPFEDGFTAPSGEVWLEKSRAPADSVRRYHVVDRTGQLIEEVHLPGQGRILGLGDSTALLGEPTSDGTRLISILLPRRTGADTPATSTKEVP